MDRAGGNVQMKAIWITRDHEWRVDLRDYYYDHEIRICMAEQMVAILMGWAPGADEVTDK
jgi:hypothetical protein